MHTHTPRPRAGSDRRAAFTLLELIVVITIIAIFGTFVMINVSGMTDEARIAKAKHDTKAIYNAAQSIESQTGRWPESIEACVNATHPDTGMKLPYTLSEFPKDPWGNEYIYERAEDGSPIVISYGADESEGGEGKNQDIVWPSQDETY